MMSFVNFTLADNPWQGLMQYKTELLILRIILNKKLALAGTTWQYQCNIKLPLLSDIYYRTLNEIIRYHCKLITSTHLQALLIVDNSIIAFCVALRMLSGCPK